MGRGWERMASFQTGQNGRRAHRPRAGIPSRDDTAAGMWGSPGSHCHSNPSEWVVRSTPQHTGGASDTHHHRPLCKVATKGPSWEIPASTSLAMQSHSEDATGPTTPRPGPPRQLTLQLFLFFFSSKLRERQDTSPVWVSHSPSLSTIKTRLDVSVLNTRRKLCLPCAHVLL